MRDKHATCRVRAFGAGPSVAGAFTCADDFQVSEASAIGVNLQSGSVVLYEGFSLWDALYFYAAAIKLLPCQLLHLFASNGRSPIPTVRICCSTNGEIGGLS